MRCDILTLFPEQCRAPLESSILGRARECKILEVRLIDIRDFTEDRHRTVDDTPYGGGEGMVFKPEPLFRAVRSVPGHQQACRILLTPQGERFTQAVARELARLPHLILICGRYEGFDERIRSLATREISLGDFVLTGGEIAALAVLDATARLLPGVLGNVGSTREESFADRLLEYPHYTRPPEFEGLAVPPELLSGDHLRIKLWRRFKQLERTRRRRPDLLDQAGLDELDQLMLQGIEAGQDFEQNAARYLKEARRRGRS